MMIISVGTYSKLLILKKVKSIEIMLLFKKTTYCLNKDLGIRFVNQIFISFHHSLFPYHFVFHNFFNNTSLPWDELLYFCLYVEKYDIIYCITSIQNTNTFCIILFNELLFHYRNLKVSVLYHKPYLYKKNVNTGT